MQSWEIEALIAELRSYSAERDWFEFKVNNTNPDHIGQTISALANTACLYDLSCGYLLYGIEDGSHDIVGTSFDPWTETRGNQAFLIWLNSLFSPTIDIEVHEWTSSDGKKLLVIKIPAAVETPVRFSGNAYIRVGNSTTLLKNYPDKERKIWQNKSPEEFEVAPAKERIGIDDILRLLDYSVFYSHQEQRIPDLREKIVDDFINERFILRNDETYTITNLGALLLAHDLRNFPHLEDRSLRLIHYADRTQMTFLDDQIGRRGYASASAADYKRFRSIRRCSVWRPRAPPIAADRRVRPSSF